MNQSEEITTVVRGGFFWEQDTAAVYVGSNMHIENCMFSSRPQRWQLLQWYRVLRNLADLPHTAPLPAGAALRQSSRFLLWDLTWLLRRYPAVIIPAIAGAVVVRSKVKR